MLLEQFRALPARRLVILGEGGSGKSVLALMLAHGLRRTAAQGEGLAVVVPVDQWDPVREDVAGLLARYLGRVHGLRSGRELVVSGRVLPVLDGLDELAPAARQRAVARIQDHAGADGESWAVSPARSEA